MKYKPLGYRVLIKMEEVEQQVKKGALKGFQLQSDQEQIKEQHGHCIGRVVAFGPTAYQGYAGCEGRDAPAKWGVKVGDLVEFRRYDGKPLTYNEDKTLRIVNDVHLLAVINNE